jgi:hypothetical protein
MGAGKKLWGYYPTTKTWIPLQVDANGKVVVDLSAVKLDNLGDVSVPTPTDGYVLYWDAATSLWKCKAAPAGTWASLTGKPDSPSLEELATEHEADGTHGAITPTSCGLMTTHVAAADPHTGYRLESADHSHQSTGAQAGKLDHGLALDGLSDDDHPQYIKHSLATAISDFLVASGAGVFIKKTLAEVKTLLDWAADIATHAALTTGVHGVGANYIPAAPAASHLVRAFTKGWTSGYFNKGAGVDADPTEVYLPEFISDWFHEQWTNNPEVAGTVWTVAFVGSGDIPWWAPGRLQLSTLATINSFVRVYSQSAGLLMYAAGLIGFWSTQWADTDRTTSTVLLGIWINTAGVPPSLTAHHVGFKVLNGAIYATNADGTTEKATDTGITYDAQWNTRRLWFVVRSGAIDYYVDDVLKVTHTANLPTFTAGYLYNSITNAVAATRSFEVKIINIRGA